MIFGAVALILRYYSRKSQIKSLYLPDNSSLNGRYKGNKLTIKNEEDSDHQWP